jgi:hypothetical protein
MNQVDDFEIVVIKMIHINVVQLPFVNMFILVNVFDNKIVLMVLNIH